MDRSLRTKRLQLHEKKGCEAHFTKCITAQHEGPGAALNVLLMFRDACNDTGMERVLSAVVWGHVSGARGEDVCTTAVLGASPTATMTSQR